MKGMEKLQKDTSRNKPVYIYEDTLFWGGSGLTLDGSESTLSTSWLYELQAFIEDDLGGKLMYRGVKGEQLDQILESGTDIPNLKKGDKTFATRYLEKSTEYGTSNTISGQPLKENLCVILYKLEGLKDVFNSYEVTFLKDPKEILRGALVFKNIAK